MSKTYRIVMRGPRPGHAPDEVAQRLAELFKVDAEQAASMLSEGALSIKRGVDLDTALKYQSSLEKRGCASLIEPEHREPAPLSAIKVTTSATDQGSHLSKLRTAAGVVILAVGLLIAFVLARVSGI